MKNSQYHAINAVGLSCFALAFISLIMFIVGIGEYNNQFVGSALFYFIIATFVLSIGGIIAFFAWIRKTKVGHLYNEEYERRMLQKVEKQTLSPLLHWMPSSLSPYYGNQSFRKNYLVVGILICIIYSVPIVGFAYKLCRTSGHLNAKIYGIVALLLIGFLAGLCFVVWVFFLCRVVIDDTGVHLKKYGKRTRHYKWSDIRTIGLSTSPMGRNMEICYIYISKREVEGPRCIYEPDKIKGAIVLRYRPKVIHCILQYWEGKIVNLEKQKSWLKYLRRIGEDI